MTLFQMTLQLVYTFRQLKNAGRIHSTWFLSNVINVKLNERNQPSLLDFQYLI